MKTPKLDSRFVDALFNVVTHGISDEARHFSECRMDGGTYDDHIYHDYAVLAEWLRAAGEEVYVPEIDEPVDV